MAEAIEKILKQIELQKPQTYKNMKVIGINIPDTKIDLMSLETGLDMGLVEITEINENASVGEVKVINNAVTPLILLDGEEIIGSKQNRIVNATIIIPPKTEKIIPVSCVEEGRWEYKTKKFKYSNHMATRRVRRDKQTSINQSLKSSNTYRSDQGQVWNNVRETMDLLEVESNTNALHDTYKQKQTQIQNYKEAFPKNEKQNGIIVYINGKLAGFEIIYDSARYAEYHEKLIESYIMDALQNRDKKYTEKEENKEELIEKIIQTPRETFDSVGEGKDYRLEDDEITGSIVTYNNHLINASILAKDEA